MDRAKKPDPVERRPPREPENADDTLTAEELEHARAQKSNPPRTTTNGITSPKFGSAGSGGAELEPGPERD
ncbi:MAG TPA: hypothetical protein VJU87_01520 [Gemmatimonadaceae bacterium]|nr:hypothetical protein [Gemmatimonadaceae bacterium]